MSPTTRLYSVTEDDDHGTDYEVRREPDHTPVPDFEGQPVDVTRIKLAAVSKLDTEDWSKIDDTVRMFVEGRVVRVDHVVDETTGKLMRVHTVKVVDAIPLPWDFDTGRFDS